MSKVQTRLLTMRELAKFVGRPYATVRRWVFDGRIASRAKTTKTKKSVIHRIPVKEATRVKRLITTGEWF